MLMVDLACLFQNPGVPNGAYLGRTVMVPGASAHWMFIVLLQSLIYCQGGGCNEPGDGRLSCSVGLRNISFTPGSGQENSIYTVCWKALTPGVSTAPRASCTLCLRIRVLAPEPSFAPDSVPAGYAMRGGIVSYTS